jgi:hypothetical protein
VKELAEAMDAWMTQPHEGCGLAFVTFKRKEGFNEIDVADFIRLYKVYSGWKE